MIVVLNSAPLTSTMKPVVMAVALTSASWQERATIHGYLSQSLSPWKNSHFPASWEEDRETAIIWVSFGAALLFASALTGELPDVLQDATEEVIALSMTAAIPFFDGHNDTILRLFDPRADLRDAALFFRETDQGHLDLPRARAAGMKGGFWAMFAPSPDTSDVASANLNELPPAATPDQADALAVTMRLAAGLFELERRGEGQFKVVRSFADLRDAIDRDVFAAIMHIEGAEMIGSDLDELYVLHQAGLRSLGPVWSRDNRFASGVPFRFPASPDTGPGLTEAGFALIKACNELGIMIDLSHMNEKGFWDVAKTSSAPLVATHSNAHAVAASTRNLTDAQLKAVRDSGGVVGLNYAVGFLSPEGSRDGALPLEVMLRHTDHLLGILGEDGVALGSDFDGAGIPDAIGDVRGVQVLLQAMLDHGYGRELVGKIALDNWLSVLERTW